MLVKASETVRKDTANMRGGEGVITLNHLAPDNLPMHTRIAGVITFPPGSSIGLHAHVKETELYYILEGEFDAVDDGQNVKLRVGDSLFTGGGASHTVKNNTDQTARMLAIVITE